MIRAVSAGYSGTPLARKLGVKEGATLVLLGGPPAMGEWLAPLPAGVSVHHDLAGLAPGRGPQVTARDVVVSFHTDRAGFEAALVGLAEAIKPAGSLWIAWPKKAATVPTDMTEDVVREVALPMGLVDNKVCAVSDVWSGLRLVWRRELR